MEVILNETGASAEITGVCSDVVEFWSGREALIRFSFLWDQVDEKLTKLSEGIIYDDSGLLAKFNRLSNATDWLILEKDYKKEVSKILNDVCTQLKASLRNGS